MTKKIIQTCDIVMEVTWLLALVSIPIYFNIYTSRVFEPDKITLFRSLVLVMLVAWFTKGLTRLAVEREAARERVGPRRTLRSREATEIIYPPDGEVIGPDTRPFPQNVLRRPLMLFSFFLGFAYVLSTIFSITPGVSWWGSYQRLQGTYSFLSYVLFFLVIAFNMRERRQVERLTSFVLLGNMPVALYGLLQHYKADPLPWQGDVVFRVTSSMGNAIFISAYLIMVVPLLIYRIVTTGRWLLENRTQANRYFRGRNRDTALSWVALYGCFIIFLVGLFFVILNFSANYRPEDTGGVALASDLPRLAGDSASAESRALIGNESIGPWWALPIGILFSFGLFFLFTVRRRGTDSNYLFRLFEFGAYLTLILIVVLTILYSQSRGPEAGVLAGVFVFFPLLFWRRKAWKWLIGWLGVGLIGGGLLVMFNLPIGSTPLEPLFKVARQNDQIARLGQFFETNDGTGKVRQLIWKTVLEAVGDAAKEEPARLIVGYGPESLYNVSPRHYQAELGQIEARNAIPDRSHNGYLDALVTTGVLGLITYIIFVLAFFYYSLRLLWRTNRFDYQVLLVGLISVMVAHQIEIQTGIQIVATWMMFWTISALVVVLSGLIFGRWDAFGLKATAIDEPVLDVPNAGPVELSAAASVAEQPEPALVGKNAKKGNNPATKGKATTRNDRPKEPTKETGGARNNGPARPLGGTRRSGPVYATSAADLDLRLPEGPVRVWFWAVVGVVGVVALAYAWFGNILPILADTVYKQGSNLASVQQWRRAAPHFEQALIYAPNEDFYALYTGQSYLEIAQSLSKEATTDKTKQTSMLAYLGASERELLRANKIAPLNPDHYANLARLYTRWADLEPGRAAEFYKRSVAEYELVVKDYAPRNPRLWGELALAQANIATNRNDPDLNGSPIVDKPLLDKALLSAEQAVKLDDKYDFTRLLLGDIYRYSGRQAEAGVQYLALAQIDPHQLASDARFARRVQSMAQSPQVPVEKALAIFDPVKAETITDKSKVTNEKGFAWLGRGMIYYYKNNLEEAQQALSSSVNFASSDPFAHAFLALVYRRTGQANLAESEAAQARDLAGKVPQNAQQAQQAIDLLLRSQ